MAFSTQRGRPKSRAPETDPGTPELRLKHALGATAEPIDLCLSKSLITVGQHRAALHLRWLYTIRYGAPVITTRYGDRELMGTTPEDDPLWRSSREAEYHAATALLKQHRRYETVMRIAIYNEQPAFLNPALLSKSWRSPALAEQLLLARHTLCEGLELLTIHWKAAHRRTQNAQKLAKMSP